jgi:hypothetical protein
MTYVAMSTDGVADASTPAYDCPSCAARWTLAQLRYRVSCPSCGSGLVAATPDGDPDATQEAAPDQPHGLTADDR